MVAAYHGSRGASPYQMSNAAISDLDGTLVDSNDLHVQGVAGKHQWLSPDEPLCWRKVRGHLDCFSAIAPRQTNLSAIKSSDNSADNLVTPTSLIIVTDRGSLKAYKVTETPNRGPICN